MARRKTKASTQGRFYDRYTPADRFLLKPATAVGRPGMIEATAPNGDTVLIREWPRRTKGDEDLLEIWKHELRQLHRLGGYPGAQRYIARLVDADSDEKGFYIALDAGQRRPLEVLLERGRGLADWLRALNLPANRHRLWSNLRRIALGLEILHNEGLVHRNLDGWSVLTSAGDDPDFQLTGFEWSLRLSSTPDKPVKGRSPQPPSVSFSADWAAFARLSARVLNITEGRLTDREIPDYEVHESASALEIRLLRDLLFPGDRIRLDGELVSSRIDQLLEALGAARASADGRYHLGVRLGRDSNLSAAVREGSGLEIETDDTASQLSWIASDLGPTLHMIAVDKGDTAQLYLRGRDLVYRLKKYDSRDPNDKPSWQFAFCESAEPAASWRRVVSGSAELPSTALKLLLHNEARQSWGRLRGRTPSWAEQIEAMTATAPSVLTPESRVHRAVTLLHTLQIALASANAFQVRVVRSGSDDEVELQYVSTPEAEEISKSLGIDPPLVRLKESLDEERFGEGEGWVLSEAARLGQAQAGDVELTFDEAAADDSARFRFRMVGMAPTLIGLGYLIPGGSRGDFVQFRRRSKALRLLKEHAELLQVLADPRRRVVATHDVVVEDESYALLDEAKQTALKELMAVLPVYMLQGPPGVGKTYLVKDVVQRRFQEDRSSRLLITAQGNHAVDHLLDELAEGWRAKPESEPLAVRCRPKEEKIQEGLYDLEPATARLAAGLWETQLAGTATPALRSKLEGLAGRGTAGDSASIAGERRSLEGLLMRAANVVFATTNSAHLERLIDERGQFDWTIVEEAGKATGAELISPLMLSHRRLMIGDHKQLPPFGSRELEKLLDDETAVRATLKTLSRVIDRAIRNLLDEELLDFIEDEAQDLVALCTEAKRLLYLFETALTTELERREGRPTPRPIASSLRVQHRMHPAICKLVSNSFYSGRLITSDERALRALAETGRIVSKDEQALPNMPVAVIDMPYERSEIGKGRIERLPRFTNEDEIAAVVSAVGNLVVKSSVPKLPSLVILTPYARQVRRLKEAVLADPISSVALAAFRPAARGDAWCSTVDAFQGNEADVVVFSLVRNNRGATIRHALGFVGDERRFNVLLSRARQKLVFVGSLEFLRTVANPFGMPGDPDSRFLRLFLKTLDEQIAGGEAGRVASVIKAAAT